MTALLPQPSGCDRCGRRLYYAARAHQHRYCQVCAATLGVEQLGDLARESLRERAAAMPVWWRWTVWLGHALLWATHDGELARLLG